MLGDITLAGIGAAVAFLVALISGIAFLHNNIKKAIVGIVEPDLKELKKNIKIIQDDIQGINEEQARYRADACRRRILSYNDELLRGVKHSKETFDQILADTDSYEDFSYNHPTYPNNKAKLAIANIKRCYAKCSEEGTFLQ